MSWLEGLFKRRRVYAELSEEIREHLQEKIEELLATGMSRKEAAAAARREFGNVALIEEDSREVWRWPSMEDLATDVRYGLRILPKRPTFTLTVVLTLAIGIGGNTAMFTLIRAVLLKPLEYQDPDRLVPVDALRELEKAGVVGKLHDCFVSTSGLANPLANSRRLGREIAEKLKADGVEAVILTST